MADDICVIPLFSSSEGNSTLVRVRDHNFLIDIGKNCKQTCLALSKVNTLPEDIDGVFITHYHSDHVAGMDVFGRKYKVPFYATEGTFDYMKYNRGRAPANTDVRIDEKSVVTFDFGVEVSSYPTPHDAVGSVVYRIKNCSTGRSAVVMTDLGYVTKGMLKFAEGADIALIESNYDKMMLEYGEYPEPLKRRIKGEGGHISNDESKMFAEYLIDNGTEKIILAHISPHNNTPEIARETVTSYLEERGKTEGKDYFLQTADRFNPGKGFKA